MLAAQKSARVNMRTYLESMNVPTREDIARLGELVVDRRKDRPGRRSARRDRGRSPRRARRTQPACEASQASHAVAGQASHARHALQMTTTPSPMWPDPATLWSSNDRALEMARAVLGSVDAPVGLTPKELVWRKNKARLYRYVRSEPATHRTPIFLVLPLINRAYILDLRPGASFVEFLLSEGFDVFLIDWGTPGDEVIGPWT